MPATSTDSSTDSSDTTMKNRSAAAKRCYVKTVAVSVEPSSAVATMRPPAPSRRRRRSSSSEPLKTCNRCGRGMPGRNPHDRGVYCLGYDRAWEAVHAVGKCQECGAKESHIIMRRWERATVAFHVEQHARNRLRREKEKRHDEGVVMMDDAAHR